MFGTRRSAICDPGRNASTPMRSTTTPPLIFLTSVPFDRLVALVGDADRLPHAHEVGFLLRQDDRAFLVLEVLEEDLDFVAGLEVGQVLELFERDRPFGLEADVEDDHVVADPENPGLDDLAFFDRRHRAIVHRHHLLVVVGGVSSSS